MTLRSYRGWTFNNNSIKVVGGKNTTYYHYCPYEDFILISKTFIDLAKKLDGVATVEIMDALENKELSSGSKFNKEGDEYKVSITLYVLMDNNFISKRGTKKNPHSNMGRNPFKLVLEEEPKKILSWVKNLPKSKGEKYDD